ncbi:MAG: hypothetical protein GX267_06010 [Fibrobacter sp.]|jgi:processive 1,2-diacylglycerol beta-glucosyltransferase|nr:hypothetical protein [Fibrobacter sp.]
MASHSDSISFYNSLKQPLLILSSRAGRGNISIAEAIHEYFYPEANVFHKSIEDFMPRKIVNEDLLRYKFISNNLTFLLSLIYTIPFFYYRKLIREKFRTTRLYAYKEFLQSNHIKTVVCVSHRQAFWTAILKRNESLDISIYGVLTEFGNNLGWKYIFWDMIDGFISPLPANTLCMNIPGTIHFNCLALPARSIFYSIPQATTKNQCLLMGGFFGQGQIMKTLKLLHSHFPEINIHVICGDNKRLENRIKNRYRNDSNIFVYGLIDSIKDILLHCSCVITKPGMATLLEANASGRKIFLFRGIPVAEINNARYAISHFNAEWFSVSSFSKWLRTS